NADRDIVEIIAVDMAAVDLPHPSVSDFNLAIARGGAVTNDEMVGKTVRHLAHMAMIIVEDAGVTLASTAVMHDDVFPSVTRDPRIVDRLTDCRSEVLPEDTSAARSWYEVFPFFRSRLLDNDRFVVVTFAKEEPVSLFFRSRRGNLFFNRSRWSFIFPRLGMLRGGGFLILFGRRSRDCCTRARGFASRRFRRPSGIWLFERRWGRARRWFRSERWAWDNLHLLATFQKKFAQTF